MRSQTALGIDISLDRIDLALLKREKNGFELVKTASGPVPAGAIKEGNVEDPGLLAKAIKELEIRNRIRVSRAAISLVGQPVVVQIMDVPKGVATGVGKFVRNEMERCVVLSGKEIVLDYCGIGCGGQRGNSRVVVVATDVRRIAEPAKAYNQARLNVEAIEPPAFAYARAFYGKRIANKFDCNVLMAILRDGIVTLCVFKKQTVDFVRTKKISEKEASPGDLCQWLAEEISAVMQFYDMEVVDSFGKWDVLVVGHDSVELGDGAEESLRAKVACSSLEIRTGENVCQDTPVEGDSGAERASPAAIGLAMKLVSAEKSNLRVNLLPPESAEVKCVRRDALITGNIVAATMVVMILAVGGLSLVTKKVNENIARKEQMELLQETRQLLVEQGWVDEQMGQLSGKPDYMNKILSFRSDIDWPRLLSDIRKGTPKAVRLTRLLSRRGSKMFLEGLGLSYQSVRLFVTMLNKLEQIDTASATKTGRSEQDGGLVRYEIECSLLAKQGK